MLRGRDILVILPRLFIIILIVLSIFSNLQLLLNLRDQIGYLLNWNLIFLEYVWVFSIQLFGCLKGVRVQYKLIQDDGINFLFGVTGPLFVVNSDDMRLITNTDSYIDGSVPRYTMLF